MGEHSSLANIWPGFDPVSDHSRFRASWGPEHEDQEALGTQDLKS